MFLIVNPSGVNQKGVENMKPFPLPHTTFRDKRKRSPEGDLIVGLAPAVLSPDVHAMTEEHDPGGSTGPHGSGT